MSPFLRAAGVAVTEKRYTRVDHVTLIAAFGWPLRGFATVLDDGEGFTDKEP